MKWLGKASLFRIPVAGWMMWMAGDVPVERGTATRRREAMAACARWLARGMPVMLFPEGTRSKDGSCSRSRTARSGWPSRPGRTSCRGGGGTGTALPKHSWSSGGRMGG
jgi:1-acyl-sn-glycerol-3-phosphate acyltransferase